GLGFRVAPTGDQDNHYRTWGTITEARTGIIAEKLTKTNLLDAIRSRHVYATTDKNLKIIFKVNGHLCGDTNILGGSTVPNGPINITFSLSDADEPFASYQIEAFVGTIGGDKPSVVGGDHAFSGNTPNGTITDVVV